MHQFACVTSPTRCAFVPATANGSERPNDPILALENRPEEGGASISIHSNDQQQLPYTINQNGPVFVGSL